MTTAEPSRADEVRQIIVEAGQVVFAAREAEKVWRAGRRLEALDLFLGPGRDPDAPASFCRAHGLTDAETKELLASLGGVRR